MTTTVAPATGTSWGVDSEYGAGIVDARRAVTGAAPPRGPGPAPSVSVPRRQRIGYVRAHGIRLRCRARGTGSCSATVRRGGSVIAYGAHQGISGKGVTVRAGLTAAGRSALAAGRSLGVTVYVALPGARTKARHVTLYR